MTGAERVLGDLRRLEEMSDSDTGVTRLGYTEMDHRARAWFIEQCRELGLTVEVDPVGNVFGWGKSAGGNRRILMGSHLDSVVGGGAFDGTVGVTVGLEVVRRLLERDPDLPVGVANFACEESTRYGVGCIGSRYLMGLLDMDDLDELVDNDGLSALHAINAGSFTGSKIDVGDDFVAGYVEVHIDQGSLLTSMGCKIGIVDAIAGVDRISMEWTGESSHSGGRRRFERRDALLAAAQFVVEANRLWEEIEQEEGEASVAITVGKLDVRPNGPNTVAGHVHLIADVRSSDDGRLSQTADRLTAAAREVARSHRVELRAESMGRFDPVPMDPGLTRVLEAAAADLQIDGRTAPSLSGHDAMILGRRFPVALLLLPNPTGISHAPDEAVDAAALAQVCDLLEAALPKMLEREPIGS